MRVGTPRSPAVTRATTTRTIERPRVSFSDRARRRLRWLLPVVIVWTSACAAPPAKAPPAKAAARALHRGPLTDFVSAAGLRWLVVVKPRQLLADPELGPAIQQVVPSNRFDAFAEASGVDLRAVPEAAVAGFAYSQLYLAELPNGVASLARARFGERLLSGAVTKRPRTGLYRLTGVIGQTPETLLTIDERALVVAVGDPIPAKIAEAYAEERLKNSPTALRGAALSALPDLTAGNAAVLFAPGPFSDEWQRAAGGLLQSAVALAIAAQPIGNGKVATTLYLAGAWGDSADDATQRLAAAWQTFARSSAGRLFELNEIADVRSSPELLTLHVEFEVAALVRGLKASVLGDLSEILRIPQRTPADAREPSTAP